MCLEPRHRGAARACGFTLIEILIALAVIALLSAVALPAYQSSVRKAHRADAKTALTTGAQAMERYFTEKSKYDTATVGVAATDTVKLKSENGYYQLSLSGLATGTYILNAAPQGAQATDACGTFTLNQAGLRGVSGGSLSAAECW